MATNLSSEIQAGNQRFMETFKRGDSQGMAALYTENCLLLPPNSGFVRGRDAVGGFWQAVMDMGVKEAVLETVEVESWGDVANEIGQFTLRDGNGNTLDQGKYLVVWKRENGQWRLHQDIWNSSQPTT